MLKILPDKLGSLESEFYELQDHSKKHFVTFHQLKETIRLFLSETEHKNLSKFNLISEEIEKLWKLEPIQVPVQVDDKKLNALNKKMVSLD